MNHPCRERERPVNREAETSGKKPWELKPTYIPRLMPVGMIIILLAILIPVLREKKPGSSELTRIEAPLAMKRYSTGYASTDSLLNEALRDFGRKNYTEAAHLLTKVYFYWTVQIREGQMKSYPDDLRFYLGLAEFYRGRPDRAAPYLEEEAKASPYEDKYAWYLAHVYISQGNYAGARETLERVVKIDGRHAAEARGKMKLLPDSP
jgi:tetratricopeptide (TPR) repeat protein